MITNIIIRKACKAKNRILRQLHRHIDPNSSTDALSYVRKRFVIKRIYVNDKERRSSGSRTLLWGINVVIINAN